MKKKFETFIWTFKKNRFLKLSNFLIFRNVITNKKNEKTFFEVNSRGRGQKSRKFAIVFGWSLSELNRYQKTWTWNYNLIVKHVNIIKLKLLTINEIKCPVAPLHFNWDSSGSLPSSQETHFIVLQTWSVGQSLPTLHVLSRPFQNEL